MKRLRFFIAALLCVVITSCTSDADLKKYGDDAWMMKTIRKHFAKKSEITDCVFLTSPMPLELVCSGPFKSYRDAVYKAALDYRACKTRGLGQAMEKSLLKIGEYQNLAASRLPAIIEENDRTEFRIALITADNGHNPPKSIIAVFDPATKQMVGWETVTVPIQNTAAFIVNVERGSLVQYSLNGSQNLDSLAAVVDNPVTKFILTSHAK